MLDTRGGESYQYITTVLSWITHFEKKGKGEGRKAGREKVSKSQTESFNLVNRRYKISEVFL